MKEKLFKEHKDSNIEFVQNLRKEINGFLDKIIDEMSMENKKFNDFEKIPNKVTLSYQNLVNNLSNVGEISSFKKLKEINNHMAYFYEEDAKFNEEESVDSPEYKGFLNRMKILKRNIFQAK